MGIWQNRDSNPSLPSPKSFLSTMSLVGIKDIPSRVMISTLLSLAGGKKERKPSSVYHPNRGLQVCGIWRAERGGKNPFTNKLFLDIQETELKGKSCHFLF